jgi:hypothetical protein
MNYEEREKEFREQWFNNHKYILKQNGNIQILEWIEPKRIGRNYRYVLDENQVYINGYFGRATYVSVLNVKLNHFSDMTIHEFADKLILHNFEKIEFNCKQAFDKLKKWINRLNDQRITFDTRLMGKLFDYADMNYSKEEWINSVNTCSVWLNKLDDNWSWLYHIGDDYSDAVYAYFIGLKMANEQLRRSENEEGTEKS